MVAWKPLQLIRVQVGGRQWAESIPGAIKRTGTALVLLFTREANTSKHVARELTLASSCDLTIVPFRLEDVLPEGAVEYHVAAVQWIDAFSGSAEDRLATLVRTVERAQSISNATLKHEVSSETK